MKRFFCVLAALVLMVSSMTVWTASAAVNDQFPFKQGDSGEQVTTLLKRLYTLQYLNTYQIKSGKFTSEATDAVKKFQRKNGLEETGIVNQADWDVLFSDQAINAYDIVWNDTNNYKATDKYTLIGDDQFCAGQDGNVILIILDTYSNSFLDAVLREDPEYAEGLEDFTYYDNYCSTYMGTYPSMAHLLTGYEYSNEVTIGQWFHDAWTSDSCQYFFGKLKEYGYDSYFYSVAPVNCGIKSESMAYFSNQIENSTYEGTYVKAKVSENFATYVQNGVTAVEGKRFIIQHLKGMHDPYKVGTTGNVKSSAKMEDSMRGWLVITKAYLEQLKLAGVYDNSTIIITADHGTKNSGNLQPIFLIKEAGKTGTKLERTNAPVTHCELQATILKNIGVPDDELPGKTIYDFEEDEERERTFYLNHRNSKYGRLPQYNGRGEGTHNIWLAFTYTGDGSDLRKQYLRGKSFEVRMNQSFN